jgi:hypothetical protein
VSFNVAICTLPAPADDVAWEAVDGLINAQGDAPAIFRELHDLTAKYPSIWALPDDEIDSGVWSDGPLWNNFGHRAAVLGMIWSRAEEVFPFLVQTANSLGLTVFEWGA